MTKEGEREAEDAVSDLCRGELEGRKRGFCVQFYSHLYVLWAEGKGRHSLV